MASEASAMLFKRATLAQQAGDKATAIACLQELVASDPKHEAAWIMLGGLLSDPHQAIVCLQNALAINPDSDAARRGLAWWQKQLAAQSSERQKAREHMARAEEMARANRLIEAIEEYRVAVGLESELLEGWLALGATCQQQGCPDDAAFAYRQALALNPQNPVAEQALRALKLPLSRSGSLLWSTDIVESESENFAVSSNGQRILLASGGVAALAPSEASARQSGRLHLLDRRGNLQTLNTNWKIWQAGLSEEGALVYAAQAARAGAMVVWLDPTEPATPAMQQLLQGGPPGVWRRRNDVLVVTTQLDPILGVDLDGSILWQIPHERCDSVKFYPASDEQTCIAVTETLQAFTTNSQAYMFTAAGQLLWYTAYSHQLLSATIMETGLRALITTAKLTESINQQGETVWKKSFKDTTQSLLSPTQQVVVVQYDHAAALEALDAWSGRMLWQRATPFMNDIKFVSLGQTMLLVLHNKTVLEALDAHHGNPLWRIDLAQYAQETGQIVAAGNDWLAVLLGQVLVTLDKSGRVLGTAHFSSRNISARAAGKQARGVIVTEDERRIMLIDVTGKTIWTQTVPAGDWQILPHSPYLVVRGQKTADRHTVSLLRWK